MLSKYCLGSLAGLLSESGVLSTLFCCPRLDCSGRGPCVRCYAHLAYTPSSIWFVTMAARRQALRRGSLAADRAGVRLSFQTPLAGYTLAACFSAARGWKSVLTIVFDSVMNIYCYIYIQSLIKVIKCTPPLPPPPLGSLQVIKILFQ